MRILLVEDDRAVAEPLAQALRRAGFAPELAGTAAEALALAHRSKPDLVLLDLQLPDGDGHDVCRALRRDSDVPIVMVTARGSEVERIVGLELGADDYVVKPFSSGELVARIRSVLRRAVPRERRERVLVAGRVRVDEDARRASVDGRELDLTATEFDLLARLARDAGRVVRRERLMADVWQTTWLGSMKTLDVHVGALRRKLGGETADPRARRCLETVRGIGFRLSTGEEP